MKSLVKKPFPDLIQVGLLLAVCFLLLYSLGVPLQKWDLHRGLLVTQIIIFLGCSFLMMVMAGVTFKTALSLYRPSALAMILPIFIMSSLMLLISELMVYQNMYFPLPENYRQMMETLGGHSKTPFEFCQMILLVAFLPGICEEVMFRGVVLSGIRQKLPAAWSVVAVAIVFGIFHLSPYRFIPTSLIGLVLGYMTVRTGSIFPAMFAHFLNNGLAFTLRQFARIDDVLWLQESDHVPLPVLFTAGLIFITAMLILPEAKRFNQTLA
ncbi:MAG: CPBP family intramembrane metalloprotease [Deltaproteobacteria bacterium]|nr:CPBP family intramembrane metalloprotease [Deltaproteobacteria bacterium]